jgi:pimeloyl-ACP methyl ester carboxylesterase
MASAPIILVPGFWLGGWAWDGVAAALRADGHEVTALTLPGLESAGADRSAITMSDQVDAICQAVKAAGRPVMLAVHSGASVPGYAASDRIPGQIAAMVYVDTGPASTPVSSGIDGTEWPCLRGTNSTRTWTGSARNNSKRSVSVPCRSPRVQSARAQN